MPYITLQPQDNLDPLSIYYEIWGNAAAPPLILVHELGGTLESFRAFGKLMAENYCVVAFDQRGAGLSEKPTAPFKLTDLANDIARLANALAITRPFHVMGLAMGAVTALHFAVQHPADVAALILCDGTSETNDAARKYLLDCATSVRSKGMRAVADQTVKGAFRGMVELANNPAWAAYRERFVCNAPESYAMQCEALAGLDIGANDLAKVKCRTLGLTGKHDVIWPPAVGQALISKLANARFEVIENAAHFPPIQDTHHVAKRITQFLQNGALDPS